MDAIAWCRYRRRASYLGRLMRLFGEEFATEWGIAVGWLDEDLWVNQGRIQLRPLR